MPKVRVKLCFLSQALTFCGEVSICRCTSFNPQQIHTVLLKAGKLPNGLLKFKNFHRHYSYGETFGYLAAGSQMLHEQNIQH
jgi:hypothetical protein